MADSFKGGVLPRRAASGERSHAERGEVRARVAIQGASVEALTGDETFRIPVARSSLTREGTRIVVRDEEGSLVIWSDDDAFLDALERAQRGTLKDQVKHIRGADRRRRARKTLGKVLVAAAVLYAVSVPLLRWAVRGGIPVLGDWIGESALEHLGLPPGVAPTVEQRLAAIADQLRPACSPSTRSFRLVLAGYADVHSFSLPPDVVVVTSGLVCGAEDADLVIQVVARELAHLESRDVHHRVAEAVDWHTPLGLLLGDAGGLRDRMLDFADSRRSPGFTPDQEIAADGRATALLKLAGVALAPGQDLPGLTARLKQLRVDVPENSPPPAAAGGDEAADWAKVRAEACSVLGR